MTRSRKIALAAAGLAVLAAAAIVLAVATGGDDASTSRAHGDLDADEIARQVEAGELEPEEAERLLREQARERRAEPKARRVTENVYDLLAEEGGDKNSTDVDSASFCEKMSAEAREETIDYVRRSSGIARQWDCESAVEQLVIRSKRQGGFKAIRKAKVIGINAEGDRATASIRFGNGTISSVALVREDGEWKLASAPAGADGAVEANEGE